MGAIQAVCVLGEGERLSWEVWVSLEEGAVLDLRLCSSILSGSPADQHIVPSALPHTHRNSLLLSQGLPRLGV